MKPPPVPSAAAPSSSASAAPPPRADQIAAYASARRRARERGINPVLYWLVRAVLQPFFHPVGSEQSSREPLGPAEAQRAA